MEKDCYQEIIAEVSKKLAEKFRPVQLGIAHLFKTLSAIRMIMQRA